ncbi:MAG: FKBP-type peptidyl-prolyl cis-trans isomerase, partial [Spongiibacteraceae bacterium]
MKITQDSHISLHFSLAMQDGSEIDSTFSRAPASFDYGDGSLLPGIERKLQGLSAGDTETFTIYPEDGFGQINPANVQRFPRSQFAADLELKEGLVISFADAARAELPGVVKHFDDDQVEV